jgi:hypothetical protein
VLCLGLGELVPSKTSVDYDLFLMTSPVPPTSR